MVSRSGLSAAPPWASPGLTPAALGANTGVFSALQQVLLRPLPYPGAEDAVYVFREDPGGTFQVSPMLEQVGRWRESASSFTAVEAFEGTRDFEIGVRTALGARPGQVPGLVAARGAALAAVELAASLAASLALGRLLESQLRGVTAHDPAVLTAAAGLLAAATALATLLPALRAARLDPARVLREE